MCCTLGFKLLLYNVPTLPSPTFTLSFRSTGPLVFASGKRSRSPLRMNGTRIRKVYGYVDRGIDVFSPRTKRLSMSTMIDRQGKSLEGRLDRTLRSSVVTGKPTQSTTYTE